MLRLYWWGATKPDVDIRLLADTYFLLGTAIINQECVVKILVAGSGSRYTSPTTRLSRTREQDRTHQNKSNRQGKDEAKVLVKWAHRRPAAVLGGSTIQDGDVFNHPEWDTVQSSKELYAHFHQECPKSKFGAFHVTTGQDWNISIFSSMQEYSTSCATLKPGSERIKQRMFDKLLPWQSNLHPGWWMPQCNYSSPESLTTAAWHEGEAGHKENEQITTLQIRTGTSKETVETNLLCDSTKGLNFAFILF